MASITVGQFYPSGSVLHRLDPRTKLFGSMILIASLFVSNNSVCYALATIFLIFLIGVSRVPFSYLIRGMRGILILLVISVSFQLFMTPGEHVIFQWKFLKMNWEGVTRAIFMMMRLTYLIIGSSLLTLTTTPNDLTDGMEKSLGILKKIGVPVHEMAMMMSIALRFIPILVEETEKIMAAQKARGADFESGNLIRRVKALVPVLVPLFISAFRRAGDLAMAMEARCYHGGDGRTKMKPLVYAARDRIAYLIVLIYLALVILGRLIPILLPALAESRIFIHM